MECWTTQHWSSSLPLIAKVRKMCYPPSMAHTPESRARDMAKRNKRREDWFKENGPCVRCGSVDRLELDHVDPSIKEKTWHHALWSWRQEKREAELAKCQALCYSCHKAKHAAQYTVAHGASGYLSRKCRCEICVEWKRQALRRETRRQGRKFREPRARQTVSHPTANGAIVGNTGATGSDSQALGQSI